jgi:hypothetical protein
MLIREGPGSHIMSQSGFAICKLHWQLISCIISIGLVPACSQMIILLGLKFAM